MIVARFLQAAFESTAATMVGGMIADIWSTKEYIFLIKVSLVMSNLFFFRCGLPMSVFALTALGGTGLEPVFSGGSR